MLVLLIVGLDQAAKALVQSSMTPSESLPLIPSILHLTYVQNTGAAFGLFRGHAAVFMLASVAIIGWILWELRPRPARSGSRGGRSSPRRPAAILSLCLILAGAVGNIIDRVRLGYVVDFIDVRVWPVFNLADSAISIGVGLLLLQSVKGRGARGEGRGK